MVRVRLIVIALLVLFASVASADTKSGILIQQTLTPVAQPYLGLAGNAVNAATQTCGSTLGNNFCSVYRGDVLVDKGGVYGAGVQTPFPVFNSQLNNGAQGQAIGYWAYVQARGKGNALFGNAVINCYQGGENPIGSADSTSECSGLGEFESNQGTHIFSATLSGSPAVGATTISYTGPTDEAYVGARTLLNLSKTYAAGTFTSFASANTILTFSGTSFLSLSPTTGWYLKIGSSTEYYSPSCAGDDVDFGQCVGHWYKVENFIDNTHLTLTGHYDSSHLSSAVPGATYMLMQGMEALAVDTVAHRFTLPTNNFAWSNGNILYQLPAHVQGMIGLNLISRKMWKTGVTTVASAAVKLLNLGPQKADYGVWITGDTGTGKGGFDNAILIDGFYGNVGIDVRGTAPVAMRINTSTTGTNNVLGFGTSAQATINYVDATTTGAPTPQIKMGGNVPISPTIGIYPDSGGYKHKRAAVGCTTAASAGATCTSAAQTWTTAFSNTSYTLTCTLASPTNVPRLLYVTPSAGSFTITIEAATAAAATADYHCTAVHD